MITEKVWPGFGDLFICQPMRFRGTFVIGPTTGTIVPQVAGRKDERKVSRGSYAALRDFGWFCGEREIRLTDLAKGFCFRTAEKRSRQIPALFYNSSVGGYREIKLTDLMIWKRKNIRVSSIYMWFIQSQKLIEKRCAASSGSTAVTSV